MTGKLEHLQFKNRNIFHEYHSTKLAIEHKISCFAWTIWQWAERITTFDKKIVENCCWNTLARSLGNKIFSVLIIRRHVYGRQILCRQCNTNNIYVKKKTIREEIQWTCDSSWVQIISWSLQEKTTEDTEQKDQTR